MGIVILPLLFGAFVIGIISLIKTIRLFKSKKIGIKECLFGLVLSIVIFGLICYSYILEGKAYVLSPAFRIPIYMVFIPFLIHIGTKKSANSFLNYSSKIILISVVITTILVIIFNNIFSELIDYLRIEKIF